MSERKRYVFPVDRIGHLWYHANASQGQARNASNNFYFVGDTIYSYGSHFPIARRLECGTVLLTSRTYSVTTARHISRVQQSIPRSATVFYVENPLASLSDIASEFSASVREAREALQASRNKAQRVNRWQALRAAIANANAFASFAKMRGRYKLPANACELDELSKEYFDKLEAKRSVREAQRSAEWARRSAEWQREREERERLEALTLAERAELWRAGTIGNSMLPWNAPTMLRIRGDIVETSKGADFPLTHAKRAAEFLAPKLASGESFATNGRVVRLGVFQVDSLDENGTLRAGCHTIKRDELERFVALLAE